MVNEHMATKPVVVGIDGSNDSKAALQWAVEYGKRFDLPVYAVAVWELPLAFGNMATYPETGAQVEERTSKVLNEAVQEAVGADSGVLQRTERGHPAKTLVEISESAELLVLGTRGRGAFRGMLLGSVSQHCASHSKCPFVVIRHPESDVEAK
ncbi:Universal stress protein family [Arthrobacter rhombi]|uniref:Universal stress protein family n=2 Tax=Arthrobacter TaxID=1663 RepID=A0A1R4FP89_9MICC|nr:Universal stress protein family [Arthrobacter rhombi]